MKKSLSVLIVVFMLIIVSGCSKKAVSPATTGSAQETKKTSLEELCERDSVEQIKAGFSGTKDAFYSQCISTFSSENMKIGIKLKYSTDPDSHFHDIIQSCNDKTGGLWLACLSDKI